jgi:hypothetical protein
MPVILSLLPNTYWIYNNPQTNNISVYDFNIEVKKQCEYNNIKTIIDLDDKLIFWGKSKNYIEDIKNEIEKKEFQKLLLLLKKINEIIKNAYLANHPIIITSYKPEFIEIGLVVWIYFFHMNSNMSFDNVIKLLGIKLIGNIVLTETSKKFLALINTL